MTDHPDFPPVSASEDRAMGHARVEFAELLFQEADDAGPGGAAATELTAQVQATMAMAMYYELRHGNDLLAAHTRALEQHTLAMAEFAARFIPAQATAVEHELPPAREPVD